MRFLTFSAVLIICAACVTAATLNVVSEDNTPSAPLPINGAAVDEVLVESSLYIKPKTNLRPQVRRVRSIPFAMPLNSASLLEHVRVKRMPQAGQSQATAAADSNSFNFGPFGANSAAANAGSQAFNAIGPNGGFGPQSGQSQATAAADSNSFNFGPFGANSAAANAGSQAFNTFGPNGGFGASSAGTLTQASQFGAFGPQNSAGASMSQVYRLPNGQVINFASTNTFANGPNGNNANSRGSSVSVSQR